jgi:peptide/nickel transport system permease protein
VITVVGLQVGTLLGGAVITEMVFSLPGLGKMLVDGIMNRDLPVVQGACLVAVLFVIVVNFLVDILYTIVDPRMNAKNGSK